MNVMTDRRSYDPDAFMQAYVDFMTTEGSHNDTYAESYHRDFFANWANGKRPLSQCAGPEKHDTPSIGAFVTLPPVVAASLDAPDFSTIVTNHLFLTHRSEALAKYAVVYCELLRNVMKGKDLRSETLVAASKIGIDLASLLERNLSDNIVCGEVFGPACYISSSLPLILYWAHKYAGNFEQGVLANTNCGGENCHRGSALGALLGAACGADKIPIALKDGLVESEIIRSTVDNFAKAFAKC
jgi:ADP-ribosylglycohydrolase